MKLITTLLAAVLSAFVVSSAFANEAAKVETPTAEKTEAKKPVKKHNHMEEKTGIPMSAPATDEHHKSSKAETVKTETAEAKKPAKKHSHMEEKTGIPMPAPATGSGN